jgi:hypothetical protein
MAYQRKITKAKKWHNARKRGNERSRKAREARMAEMNWAADQENLSEMAWSSAGASWETEADNSNGTHIYEVLANRITDVEQYCYRREVTFKLDNDKTYQFIATMGHDGDHEYDEPYEVAAYQETVTKYRKQ